MKRFLALMFLVVSLVTLAAPVFAYPPVFENNNSEDNELCGDLISIGFACPTCGKCLPGTWTQAQIRAHLDNCQER